MNFGPQAQELVSTLFAFCTVLSSQDFQAALNQESHESHETAKAIQDRAQNIVSCLQTLVNDTVQHFGAQVTEFNLQEMMTQAALGIAGAE